MKKDKQKFSEEDDGRVFADMSVLDDIAPKLSLRSKKRKKTTLDEQGYPVEKETIDLSKEEKKAIVRGVIKAHLLFAIMGVLVLAAIFFLLVKVWLN